MSHVELVEAQGSAGAYSLIAAAFFLTLFGLAWLAVHGGPSWLAIYRRGRDYRHRIRAARHRRTSLHHLTFRSPLR